MNELSLLHFPVQLKSVSNASKLNCNFLKPMFWFSIKKHENIFSRFTFYCLPFTQWRSHRMSQFVYKVHFCKSSLHNVCIYFKVRVYTDWFANKCPNQCLNKNEISCRPIKLELLNFHNPFQTYNSLQKLVYDPIKSLQPKISAMQHQPRLQSKQTYGRELANFFINKIKVDFKCSIPIDFQMTSIKIR